MSRGRDDDPLAWGGDDDPTLEVGAKPAAREPVVEPAAQPEATEPDTVETTDAETKALPDGFTAVGKGSDEVGRIRADGSVSMPGEREPMGNATLITLGILGGVYLIYSIGWIIGALRLDTVAPMLIVSAAAYVPAFWLAVLAPALWFGVTLWLTRRSAAWVRIVWLIGEPCSSSPGPSS